MKLFHIIIFIILLVSWPYGMLTNQKSVSFLLSITGATRYSYNENFYSRIISEEEMKSGFRLVLNTWVNTRCSGKHAYMRECIEGKTFTVIGFSASIGSMKGLPVANFLYAFDK